jgi:hypothetical protein
MLESTNFFGETFAEQLKELESQEKFALVRKLWALPASRCDHLSDFACSTFIEYVADELERLRRHRKLFAVQDFQGTFAIIEQLSANPSWTYTDTLTKISEDYPGVPLKSVRRSIELAVRLWLTLDIHSAEIRVGPESIDRFPIDWNLSLTLAQLLENQFKRRTITHSKDNFPRFDRKLTATYLVKTCGIRVQWSDNIATHLDFDLEGLVLTIYRQKASLISQIGSSQKIPIPKKMLEEALGTLDLLFPFGNTATKSLLFEKGQPSLYTLGASKTHVDLDLAHYEYYGDKLEQLLEAFDKTTQTWRQLAFDRRNKLEWSAFWVTIMVALLTIISIPCNIIQATYSVMAYQAALSQAKAQQNGS